MKPGLRWTAVLIGILFFMNLLSGQAPKPKTASLVVVVRGARNTRGEMRVALWRGGEGFPEDASKALAVRTTRIADAAGTTVVFDGIPPGVYAVTAFHDENGNGRLDANPLGIPTEGHGASNNPSMSFGPPRWEEAKFALRLPQQTVELRLVY